MKRILIIFALILMGNLHSQSIEFDGKTLKIDDKEITKGAVMKIIVKTDVKYCCVRQGEVRIASVPLKINDFDASVYPLIIHKVEKISEKKGKIEIRFATDSTPLSDKVWVTDLEKALKENEIEFVLD